MSAPTDIHMDLFETKVDDLDYWGGITVGEVLDETNKTLEVAMHRARVKGANTAYPLIVKRGDKGFVILDGCHRLVKLVKYEGRQMIPCVVIPEDSLMHCRVGARRPTGAHVSSP